MGRYNVVVEDDEDVVWVLQILQSMFTIKTIFAIMLSLLSCYLFHDPRFFLFLLSFIDNDYVGFNYV